jgi:hypothetical protein
MDLWREFREVFSRGYDSDGNSRGRSQESFLEVGLSPVSDTSQRSIDRGKPFPLREFVVALDLEGGAAVGVALAFVGAFSGEAP